MLAARDSIAATLPTPFEMEEAVVFVLDADGVAHSSRSADVYCGLRDLVTSFVLEPHHVAVGLMTTGWASPLTEGAPSEVAPSEHPCRERVQLTACVDREFQVVNVVRFSEREELIIENEGEGPLADALAVTLVTMLRAAARRSVDG